LVIFGACEFGFYLVIKNLIIPTIIKFLMQRAGALKSEEGDTKSLKYLKLLEYCAYDV
jgi:hypothetical protein